ncbi:hypothetical protein NBRC116188_15880 [Oceaniserpentilla sp. 4NH20-0058]|uniref:hypothetical protein n=1 Tax=Oceaniserpentilla sp. 4NH20-0058 TaxID=3127660 RepID=UPI0031052A0E
MAEKNERLIDRDPNAEDDEDAVSTGPFYKSSTFLMVLKVSLTLGLISTLVTGLLITNSRLSAVETLFKDTLIKTSEISEQQAVIIENVKTLTQRHNRLTSQVTTLDLDSAKGELSQALQILDTQSQAIDKQLAVTRNGLVSLSRMIKGSRVWQEDYSNQYKLLFERNKEIKKMIQDLRGIQEEKHEDLRYLEMNF